VPIPVCDLVDAPRADELLCRLVERLEYYRGSGSCLWGKHLPSDHFYSSGVLVASAVAKRLDTRGQLFQAWLQIFLILTPAADGADVLYGWTAGAMAIRYRTLRTRRIPRLLFNAFACGAILVSRPTPVCN
jgi:hypothetical protein